jgi:hypothetical protein
MCYRLRFMDIEEKRDGINEIARRAKSRYTAAERCTKLRARPK